MTLTCSYSVTGDRFLRCPEAGNSGAGGCLASPSAPGISSEPLTAEECVTCITRLAFVSSVSFRLLWQDEAVDLLAGGSCFAVLIWS